MFITLRLQFSSADDQFHGAQECDQRNDIGLPHVRIEILRYDLGGCLGLMTEAAHGGAEAGKLTNALKPQSSPKIVCLS